MNQDIAVKRKKLLRKSTKENQIHLQIDSINNGGSESSSGCGGVNDGGGDAGGGGGGVLQGDFRAPVVQDLPKKLHLEEKKYLLAVRNGNLAYTKRVIENARNWNANGGDGDGVRIDINCVDSLGRGAINLAIENENLEMVELLVVMGVEPKDALLHAINAEFVEAVELLLEYEELIYVEGEKYSWEKVDWSTAVFTPDITPLILAACKNNFEILKILLERGATIPKPHHIGCECSVCAQESRNDSLRHSMSRVNEYRALASPSLISLTSDDPILTSFELSWELRKLAKEETECHKEYTELRKQCQQFAVDLLDQTRSSEELTIVLNHYENDCANGGSDNDDAAAAANYDECECTLRSQSRSRRRISAAAKYVEPNAMSSDDIIKLPLLRLAIKYRQKQFIAHPHVQQLLSKIWYDGLPGFRSKSLPQKCYNVIVVAILFPVYCVSYMLFPDSEFGRTIKKPIMKFLTHVTSYLFFLGLLILVSQRAEVLFVQILGTERMKQNLIKSMQKQRGNPPTFLECNVLIYVLGYIKEQILEIRKVGIENYVRGSLWNSLELIKNVIYVLVIGLRIYAYACEQMEIRRDASTAFVPREKWNMFDPELVAEALFATANILSALKLVHIFSVNSHLGPLQISLGRMFIDILKFFSIYALVLFSFACGLNQLLWYYASLERKKCFTLPDDRPDWEHAAESCTKWRSFGNLFESIQTLFWTGFGEVGVDSFDLAGINSYTRFCALLMFAAYSVLNVTVLLNLLIAMMSNSYSIIADQADVEWKFARTKLWINFFEEKSTLPSPYNLLPTKKTWRYVSSLFRTCQPTLASSSSSSPPPPLQLKRDYRSEKRQKRRERRHSNHRCARIRGGRFSGVMRALVWRYMSAKHRESEKHLVTEDHLQEIKSDISGLKFQILDTLEKYAKGDSGGGGSDHPRVSKSNEYESENLSPKSTSFSSVARAVTSYNRKQRSWQRQLMNDFHVGLITKRYDEPAVEKVTGSTVAAATNAAATVAPRADCRKQYDRENDYDRSISSTILSSSPSQRNNNNTSSGVRSSSEKSCQGRQQDTSASDQRDSSTNFEPTTYATGSGNENHKHSQIGKCQSEESLKKQIQLQKAIDRAASNFKTNLPHSASRSASAGDNGDDASSRDSVKNVRFAIANDSKTST